MDIMELYTLCCKISNENNCWLIVPANPSTKVLKRPKAAYRRYRTCDSIYVESFSYGVVRELVGHGIGKICMKKADVPNFGKPGKSELIVPEWFLH